MYSGVFSLLFFFKRMTFTALY